MSIYVYKLPEFLLNGWTDFKATELNVANFNNDEEFMQPWRDEIAAFLKAGGELLKRIGWDGELDAQNDLWFAPLLSATHLALSPYMLAIRATDVIYIMSPYELPWLNAVALDKASNSSTPLKGAVH